MILLITGGSGSGKSAYAEKRIEALGKRERGRLIYIATMEPYDEESWRRIERHRNMREGKNFTTVECYTHLEKLSFGPEDLVLLECISNLTANEMYGQTGRKEQAAEWILRGIQGLAAQVRHLVIVGNNVFEDGIRYDASTARYQSNMGLIQNETAKMADEVVEVVCGIPVFLKKQEEL